ncbi:MAG: hypothetical protein JNM31_08790 [Flavobacteriales bacterium]|nr:hypothetical protein [Flavobacteriales bacterium]
MFIRGAWQNYVYNGGFPNAYQQARLFIHELAHSLTLYHTLLTSNGTTCANVNDFCSDTPSLNDLANIWGMPAPHGCCGSDDPTCSNNLLDYNNQWALTPEQLGRIHYSLTHDMLPYAVDDYCEKAITPHIVASGQSKVWKDATILTSDLVIEEDASLIVQCWVHLPADAAVIVKPGGKLILDGGYFTNICNDFWSGIEIWGDNTKNQWPTSQPAHQGMVILKNGAIIEHAREAITMQQPGVWGTFGGVVQATNASFINCRRSVEFLAYQNTSPGGAPIGNRSFFKDCAFRVDDNYRGVDDFATHASLWKVDGINFIGCKFENLQTNVTESAKRGKGITSLDASYRVLPICDAIVGLGLPCPPGDTRPCEFRGLDHGISARNAVSSNTFTVSQALFEDNVCGVYANGVVGFTVKNSRFMVGGSVVTVLSGEVDEKFNGRHRAVFSTASWIFAIDDNEVEQSGNHAETEGIVVGYSWEFNDVVFRNTATGLERAYIGEGICADISTTGDAYIKGLVFLCNGNDDNAWNFTSRRVLNDPEWPLEWHTIRTSQGTSMRPADNTFDQESGTTDDSDFLVDTQYGLIDYWHRGVGNQEPVDHTPVPGMQAVEVTFIPANNCANKVALTIPYEPGYPSGMAPGPVAEYMLEEKLAYGNTRYLYDELIDAGNTDAVVQEIQSTWPSEAWQLHAYLIGLSPHLSVDALRQMVASAILPAAMVTEVLVANPEATRADGFLTWLQEQSGHPLPQYMLGMVVASWDQHTYRGALEDEMAFHHEEMTQAANLLIHHYQTLPIAEDDSTAIRMDSIRWVWRQLRTPAARYAEALTWVDQLEFDSAAAAIARISEENILREYGEVEQQRMLDLITFMSAVYADSRSEMRLDSVEVQGLVALMDGWYDRPAAWISNLLCFGYGICRPPLTGGGAGEPKSLPYTRLPAVGSRTQPILKLHPNPANSWVALDYELPVPPKDAALVIRDIMGREVFRLKLNDQVRQVVWDVRTAAPGSYTVTLLNGGEQLRTEKLTIRQ